MVRIRPGEPFFKRLSLVARARHDEVGDMSIGPPLLFRFAAALPALMMLSCSDAEAPGTGERITISAAELGRAYAESDSAAQRKYGNRRLRVTGIVTGTGGDAADNVVLRMQGPDPLVDVHLTVSEEARAEAEGVAKGSQQTLLCEGATEVLGSPTLDGCTFEPAEEETQATNSAAT